MGEVTTTTNLPWVEKYRPTEFNKVILSETNSLIFNNILKTGYFPNIILYGPPGTGKTTTIINFIKTYLEKYFSYNKELIIHLNASDDRGIEMIRSQIMSFISSSTFFLDGYKFIILDEVDYMTKSAQQSLRHIINKNHTRVRYCLICNYITKVDYSLKQEFVSFRFNSMPDKDIISLLKNICIQENIPYTKKWLTEIQESYQYDVRSMINYIQSNQNKTILSKDKLEKCINKIIKKEDFSKALKCIETFQSKMKITDIECIEKSIPIVYDIILNQDKIDINKYDSLLRDFINMLHFEHHSVYRIPLLVSTVRHHIS